MKIIDAFTFYNELDLLYYRLSILYNIVDYFVLVESTVTHSGKEKPLYYQLNQMRYKKFADKIIYILDTDLKLAENMTITDFKRTNEIWKNENHQRNSIQKGIELIETQLSPTDYIIISDLDEIPNPELLQYIKKESNKNEDKLHHAYALSQTFYFYNLTCIQVDTIWDYSKMVQYETYCNYFKKTPQKIRMYHFKNSKFFKIIQNAGWHLSYFGDVDFIQNKLNSFAHQEFNNDKYNGTEYLKKCIQNNCFFSHPELANLQCTPINSNPNLPYMHDVYLTNFYETVISR